MYPHLKIVDQDLAEVLEHAKDVSSTFFVSWSFPVHRQDTSCVHEFSNLFMFQVWADDAPETLQKNQIDFVPHNFFEEGPVPGRDVYYVCTDSFSLAWIHDGYRHAAPQDYTRLA